MSFVLTIDGMDRTDLLRVGSLTVNSQLGNRTTCSFVLVDDTMAYWPQDGAVVSVTDDATVFVGTIENITSQIQEGVRALWHTVSAVDYNQLADRRQVAEVYETFDTITLEPHDAFDDGVIDTTLWTVQRLPSWNGRIRYVESGGWLQLILEFAGSPTTDGQAIAQSVAKTNLTGKSAVWAVDRWVDRSPDVEGSVNLWLDASNRLEWRYCNGILSARTYVAGAITTHFSASGYEPGAYRWLRIRESANVIYWEYSEDALTWTMAASTARPFAITALSIQMYAAIIGTATTNSRMLVALVNIIPVSQTLGAIVSDIAAKYLAPEGVTWGEYVETGPFIPKAVFNYENVSAAFNELANLSGYAWWIDANKALHFQRRDANAAPFAITDTSENWRKMQVTRTRSDYRNRQIVRAGVGVTDIQTESFTGDGRTRTFVTAYPVAEEPVVTKAGAALTVGIRGVDDITTVQAQWQRGSNEINLTQSVTAPTSAQAVDIQYRGEYPIIIQLDNTNAIQSRRAVEGGSGVYQMVDEDQSIDTSDMARNKARSLLRKYSTIPRIVEYETDMAGLEAGQLLTIDVSDYQLTGDFLIESVKTKEINAGILRYSVKALDGEILGGWTSFFRRMAAQGKTFVIRENEVLFRAQTTVDTLRLTSRLRLPDRSPTETLRFSDSIRHTTAAAMTAVIGTAIVGESEIEA